MSIDNRSKMVSFRLTEEEYERFRDLCYAKGIPSVSEMARSAISALLSDADITDIRALTRRVGELEAPAERTRDGTAGLPASGHLQGAQAAVSASN